LRHRRVSRGAYFASCTLVANTRFLSVYCRRVAAG
jgi:hypothetical protein